MSQLVAQIRAHGRAIQRFDFEYQIFSKDLFCLWLLNERTDSVFSLNSMLVEMSSARARMFEVIAHHILDLRHQQVQRGDKVMVKACKQRFAEQSITIEQLHTIRA